MQSSSRSKLRKKEIRQLKKIGSDTETIYETEIAEILSDACPSWRNTLPVLIVSLLYNAIVSSSGFVRDYINMCHSKVEKSEVSSFVFLFLCNSNLLGIKRFSPKECEAFFWKFYSLKSSSCLVILYSIKYFKIISTVSRRMVAKFSHIVMSQRDNLFMNMLWLQMYSHFSHALLMKIPLKNLIHGMVVIYEFILAC